MKKKNLNPLLLLLAAFVWGVAFVAQKEGMEYIGPFTYSGLRFSIASLVLAAVLPLLDRARSRSGEFKKGSRRSIWIGGLCCGLALFVGSNLQQFGIAIQDPATNVGKAGFITACYCAVVPFLSLLLKKRSPAMVWCGVAVAVVGFFFLCLMDGVAAGQGLGLGLSDLLLLLCALAFAVHILVVDHFVTLADGVRLSCIQFGVCGVLSLVCMFLFETPDIRNILACAVPILYGGVLSGGLGYTLQVVGQKGVNPAVASLILSLESVFSVLAGWALMPGSSLSMWELLGCVLVFAAVVMVNLAPQDRLEG